MTYKKLVRDRIPQIISESGQRPLTRKLSDNEFRSELRLKLEEEVAEFLEDESVEELADILEVVYALADLQGVTPGSLEAVRVKKVDARGGFNQRIYLDGVENK